MSKVVVARGLTATGITAKYLYEMNQNYENGDWLEAGKDTAFYGLAVAPVVAPNLFFGATYPYLAGIAVGLAGAYVVSDQLGLDTKPLTELILGEDLTDIPLKYIEVVAPVVIEEINNIFEESENQLLDEVEWIGNKISDGVEFGQFLYNVGEDKTTQALEWAVGNFSNPFGIY